MANDGHKKRTRAQHYVPQFYLRGFANASKKLVCYDKAADRIYSTSPADAAQETDFYEIPSGTTVEPVPVNGIEDQLHRLESIWGPRHAQLIKNADAGKITPEQLEFYSPFVALQWMRTKTYRDTAYETITGKGQTLVDDLIKLNFPDQEPKVKFTVPKEVMAAVQAEHMLNPDTILRMARGLDRLIWVVGINKTEHLFYTSDHPVVRRGNCSDQIGPRVGIRDRGVEFVFPLDSKHILLILERAYFKNWRQHDGRAVELTAEQIADYNGLQVRKSCQRVYCANNDFELAGKICKDEPGICDPNRPRVRVGSTPMIDEGDTKKNYTFVISLE